MDGVTLVENIGTTKARMAETCARVLKEAESAEPDAVFVLYRKDGLTHFRGCFFNRLEMLGAIEAAKQEVWLAE